MPRTLSWRKGRKAEGPTGEPGTECSSSVDSCGSQDKASTGAVRTMSGRPPTPTNHADGSTGALSRKPSIGSGGPCERNPATGASFSPACPPGTLSPASSASYGARNPRTGTPATVNDPPRLHVGGSETKEGQVPAGTDYDSCMEQGEATISPPLQHWGHSMSDSGSSLSTTASGTLQDSRVAPAPGACAGKQVSGSAELSDRAREALLNKKLADLERKLMGAVGVGGLEDPPALVSPTGSTCSLGSFSVSNQDSVRGLSGTYAAVSSSVNGGSIGGSSGSGGGTLNGGSTAAKKAMQIVKEKVRFGGKRQLVLVKHERDALINKWGMEKVERAEEEALQLFSSMDSCQGGAEGQISAKEFQMCLGAVGGGCVTSEFPRVLFSAIDKDKDGAISFSDMMQWLLTMAHGSDAEKLRYGFDLCDQNKDGRIDKRDLLTTIETVFSILTGLNLGDDICAKTFVNTVFGRLGVDQGGEAGKEEAPGAGREGKTAIDGDEGACYRGEPQEKDNDKPGSEGAGVEEEQQAISWEAFRAGSKSIETFMRTLGSRDISCYHTPCARSRNKTATNVVFGSSKWRFITNMMLGLEFAIRGTEERKIENLTPSPSPRQLVQANQENLLQNSLSIGSSASFMASSGWSGNSNGIGPDFLQMARGENGVGPIERQDSCVSSICGPSISSTTGLPRSTSFNFLGGSTGGGSESSSGAPAAYMERLRSDLRAQNCSKEVFSVPTSDGSRCRMACYGAEKFREVRQACGIEDDDFLLSVGIRQVIGSLLLGDLFGLSEQVSEGKSGSFFYWSQDGRYMVKTISRAESYQMRKILQSYHEHMTAHPDNLLMRILGLYRLKLNAEKWDLIVIENIFTTSHGIHERFDLKGSTYERTVGARARCSPGVVMKDKDFLELGRTIHVGPELAERLKTQIAIDTQFLARNDIIDYSFLVGVHYVDRGIPEDIWIEQQREGLEKMYADFLSVRKQYPFFRKNFGFTEFCHWAYSHHRFDKKDSLSLLDKQTGPSSIYGGVGWRSRGSRGFNSPSPTAATTLNARQGIRAYRTLQDQLDGEPDQILFFGIIDLLVPFDSRKRGEYLMKSVYHVGKQDFSVIPPQDYRKRFLQFTSNAIR